LNVLKPNVLFLSMHDKLYDIALVVERLPRYQVNSESRLRGLLQVMLCIITIAYIGRNVRGESPEAAGAGQRS